MERKIKEIMATIFEIEVDSITNATSADDIETWDSINHLEFIVALEDEFNIEFDEEEIVNLLTFELIVEYVAAKA